MHISAAVAYICQYLCSNKNIRSAFDADAVEASMCVLEICIFLCFFYEIISCQICSVQTLHEYKLFCWAFFSFLQHSFLKAWKKKRAEAKEKAEKMYTDGKKYYCDSTNECQPYCKTKIKIQFFIVCFPFKKCLFVVDYSLYIHAQAQIHISGLLFSGCCCWIKNWTRKGLLFNVYRTHLKLQRLPSKPQFG